MNDIHFIKSVFVMEFINYAQEMMYIFSLEDQSTDCKNGMITWPRYYLDLDLDY